MRLALVAAGLSAALLSACAPTAPKGVDKAVFDEAISRSIGDPGTCVLIGQQGKLIYQYGTHVVCGRKLPSCEGPGLRDLADLLKNAPTSGPDKTASCPSNAEASRVVAWSAGPIAGTDMVYAAVMEGAQTPPGIVISDKLKGVFARAGVSK